MFLVHFACYWGMVFLYDETPLSIASLNSLKNQVLCTLPLSFVVPTSVDTHWTQWFWGPFLCIVLSDVYFFCSHILLHKFMWNHHKTHHSGKVHVAKSLDADLLEHLICNLGSFVFPFLFFTPGDAFVNFWSVASTINTCISHVGHPILGDCGIHLLHHKHLKWNYGTGFYMMDRLFGTYRGVEQICTK